MPKLYDLPEFLEGRITQAHYDRSKAAKASAGAANEDGGAGKGGGPFGHAGVAAE